MEVVLVVEDIVVDVNDIVDVLVVDGLMDDVVVIVEVINGIAVVLVVDNMVAALVVDANVVDVDVVAINLELIKFSFLTCSPSRDYIDLPTTKSQVPKAFPDYLLM